MSHYFETEKSFKAIFFPWELWPTQWSHTINANWIVFTALAFRMKPWCWCIDFFSNDFQRQKQKVLRDKWARWSGLFVGQPVNDVRWVCRFLSVCLDNHLAQLYCMLRNVQTPHKTYKYDQQHVQTLVFANLNICRFILQITVWINYTKWFTTFTPC